MEIKGLKEKFLEYASQGAMTKADVATVLKLPVSTVTNLVRRKILQPIPHLIPQKFDPAECIRVFCEPSKQVRSLTSEKRSGGKPKTGGFRNVC